MGKQRISDGEEKSIRGKERGYGAGVGGCGVRFVLLGE
jgi:hypothetical protein